MKTTVRSRFLPVAAAALLVGGLATSVVEAAMIDVDDFEGYASEAAFDLAWRPVQAAQQATVPVTLDTSVAHTGSQSMRIDYNLGASPFFGQDRFDFPSQNWSTSPEVEFWYLGQATNSQEILGLRFYTSFGTEIGRVQLPIAQTRVDKWTRGVLDMSNFTPGPSNGQQNDVAQIRIALTGSDFGTGTLWIDDIRVIPEPTSLGLVVLGACGCLLCRRQLT